VSAAGARASVLVLLSAVACGDGDGQRAAQPGGRDSDADMDAAAEGEGEQGEGTAPTGSLDADEVRPTTPRIDASGAFADWLADSGIPFSAWLGDAGALGPTSPPVPALQPSLTRALIGRAYAESSYTLEEPKALRAALSAATALSDDTRLFVAAIEASDAGVEVLYGAADLLDGGLVWQKPPAHPRRFSLGAGEDGGVVSAPFTYVLEARIAAATRVYRLYLEAEQSIWSAHFSADHETLTAELRGAVTRAQLEHRPLDVLSCSAACGQNSLGFCNTGSALMLAAVLDCTGATPDLDLDRDGQKDAYTLRLALRATEVAAPRE
jgi:hypothetical protein